MELPLNQVLCGDCAEVMKAWPADSIDCIVTDPPYGLRFMGKEWDRVLPPKSAFEQMIRVLKPGALAFVMSSPRQDLMARMILLLEDAGFKTDVSFIEWIYKTGFPKAYDVSKGIDKKRGVLNERKIIGKYEIPPDSEGGNISPIRRNVNTKWHGEYKGFPNGLDITAPHSDLAKKWGGWKSISGLKPAHEPILMVNKPLSEPTIVDNVLRWGTGAINVDDCRIPFQNEDDSDLVEAKHDSVVGLSTPRANTYNWRKFDGRRTDGFTPRGRFPANLLVSDKAIDTGKITKSPDSYIRKNASGNIHAYGRGIGEPKGKLSLNYGDIGGASRYFDLDAWAEHRGFLDVPKPSRAERDFGLQDLPLRKQRKQDGSWGSHEIFEVEGSGRKTGTLNRNYHPTVKPVKLMAYLIELGCPKGGVVLDPFVGSGTTCIAARRLRRKWIGIEINPEYADIARARINPRGPLDQFTEARARIN